MGYKRSDPRTLPPARDRRCHRCGTQWRLLKPVEGWKTTYFACWRLSGSRSGAPKMTVTVLPDAGPAEMIRPGVAKDGLRTPNIARANEVLAGADRQRRRRKRKK